MKKILSIMLVSVLAVCVFAGCGKSAPDLTEVTEKYNQLTDTFNEATTLAEANGWGTDAEIVKQHNELADAIEAIKVAIEDPEQSKDIDAEVMSTDLDGLIATIEDYKEVVSVPFE